MGSLEEKKASRIDSHFKGWDSTLQIGVIGEISDKQAANNKNTNIELENKKPMIIEDSFWNSSFFRLHVKFLGLRFFLVVKFVVSILGNKHL